MKRRYDVHPFPKHPLLRRHLFHLFLFLPRATKYIYVCVRAARTNELEFSKGRPLDDDRTPYGLTPFTPFERVPSPLSSGREVLHSAEGSDPRRVDRWGAYLRRRLSSHISATLFQPRARVFVSACMTTGVFLASADSFSAPLPCEHRPFHRGRTAKEKNYSNKPTGAPCHAGVIVAESVLRLWDGSIITYYY